MLMQVFSCSSEVFDQEVAGSRDWYQECQVVVATCPQSRNGQGSERARATMRPAMTKSSGLVLVVTRSMLYLVR